MWLRIRPQRVFPQVVGPWVEEDGGGATSLFRAEPGRAPWQTRPPGTRQRALRPGLAPDRGPGLPPGQVTPLLCLFFIGVL